MAHLAQSFRTGGSFQLQLRASCVVRGWSPKDMAASVRSLARHRLWWQAFDSWCSSRAITSPHIRRCSRQGLVCRAGGESQPPSDSSRGSVSNSSSSGGGAVEAGSGREAQGSGSSGPESVPDGSVPQLEGSSSTNTDDYLPYASVSLDLTPYNLTRAERGVASGSGVGSGRFPRAAAAAHLVPSGLREAVSYQLQRVLLGGLWTKMGVYFGLGVPVVLLGALTLAAASNWTEGLDTGVLKTYGSLYKVPGVNVLNAGPPLEDFILNVFWFVGTFGFGIMLGVLNEEISSSVKALRSGLYDLPLTGHTLVVGWGPLVIPLVKQIAMAQRERQGSNLSGTLVVLADEPQSSMDSALRVALHDHPHVRWYSRSGQRTTLRDLQRCSAAEAETVFMLRQHQHQGQGSAEAADQELSAILTLAACRSALASDKGNKDMGTLLPMQRMVIQVPQLASADEQARWDAASAVAAAPGSRVECSLVEGVQGLTRLMAQSAVQPGVASMVCQLLQHSYTGAEVYSRPCPLPGPMPFGVVRSMFPGVVLVGYTTTTTHATADAAAGADANPAASGAGDSNAASTPLASQVARSNGTTISIGTGADGFASVGEGIATGDSGTGGGGAGQQQQQLLVLRVNPNDDDMVQPDDDVLALAQSMSDFEPSPSFASSSIAAATTPSPSSPSPTSLMSTPSAPAGVRTSSSTDQGTSTLPSSSTSLSTSSSSSAAAETLEQQSQQRQLQQQRTWQVQRQRDLAPQTVGVLSLRPEVLESCVTDLMAYVPHGSTIVGICEHRPCGNSNSSSGNSSNSSGGSSSESSSSNGGSNAGGGGGDGQGTLPATTLQMAAERGVAYRRVGSRPTDVSALQQAGVANFDSVVLISSPSSSSEHDTLLQSMFLSLQAALQRSSPSVGNSGNGSSAPPCLRRPLHAVASVQHSQTIEVVTGALQLLPPGMMTVEFVQPTRMLAGWLVHMALGPAIGALLRLLVDEGAFISLVPAALLLPDAVGSQIPISLQQVSDAARAAQWGGSSCTALGYVTAAGMVCLARCGPEDARVFGPADQVVLLTGGRRQVLLT